MAGERAILLHGFGQDRTIWEAVTAGLPFSCLCPDLRGHGRMSSVRPFDPGHFVADVVELARPIAPTLLVGYSMGGRVALRAALEEPALFGGLVLVSAAAGLQNEADRAARAAADSELASLLEQGRPEEFDARWEASPVWAGSGAAALAAGRSMRRACEPAALAGVLRGFGQGAVAPVWDRLAELEMPVLLVAGGRDPGYAGHAALMAASIADAEVAVVEASGHSVPLEAPEELATLIDRFSRRPRRGGS